MKVLVHGIPANFIVDTGLTGIVIDRSFAETLSLPLRYLDRKLIATSSVMHDKTAFTSDAEIEVGGVALNSPQIMVQDISWIKRANGLDVVGILGSVFFVSRVVTIDYVEHLLKVGPVPRQANGLSVLHFNSTKLPILTAQLVSADGRSTTGQFMIDTGSDDGIEVNSWFANQHPWLFESSGSKPTKELGLDGLNQYKTATTKQFNIGDARFSGLPVSISAGKGGASGRSLAGILGNQFLSHFSTITIDYKQGTVLLRP